MADNSREARERAEARLQKTQKADVVRKQAMSEYEAEGAARQKKTEKLKALRLEKEAADRMEAEAEAAAAPAKKPRRPAKKPA